MAQQADCRRGGEDRTAEDAARPALISEEGAGPDADSAEIRAGGLAEPIW